MKEKILVNNGTGVTFINIADIIMFETHDRKISMLYRKDGCESRIEIAESLISLEERIGKLGFVQIHKSYMVSLRYLEKVQGGMAIMKDQKKTRIPIGRVYLAKLMERMIKESELMI